MMKRFISLIIAIIALFCLTGVTAYGKASETVTVTVSDGTGRHAAAGVTVEAEDSDADGVITVADALYALHELKYPGGAAAGYSYSKTEYGLSLTMLWGCENGSGFGYYVDDKSCNGLSDTVKTGDDIYAFVYTDLTAWSDTYSYFDIKSASGVCGDTILLRLTKAAFDENWNPVMLPVVGAQLTIDGLATGIYTDENGCSSIKLDKAGSVIISAVSESEILVPPYCIASVSTPATAAEQTVPETAPDTMEYAVQPEISPETEVIEQSFSPATGDNTYIIIIVAVLAVAVCAILIVTRKKK